MQRLLLTMMLTLAVALLATPALAQETEAAAQAPQGLGVMMLLVGLAAAAIVGVMLARREASGDEDDLV